MKNEAVCNNVFETWVSDLCQYFDKNHCWPPYFDCSYLTSIQEWWYDKKKNEREEAKNLWFSLSQEDRRLIGLYLADD